MSAGTQFKASQAPLPPMGSEEGAPEGVKLEHTAKGPRWSIRVHRSECLDDQQMVERLYKIDALMRQRFGEPT